MSATTDTKILDALEAAHEALRQINRGRSHGAATYTAQAKVNAAITALRTEGRWPEADRLSLALQVEEERPVMDRRRQLRECLDRRA